MNTTKHVTYESILCSDRRISRILSIKYLFSCHSFHTFHYRTFFVESIDQRKKAWKLLWQRKYIQWKPANIDPHERKAVWLEHKLWYDGNSFGVFEKSIEKNLNISWWKQVWRFANCMFIYNNRKTLEKEI